MQKKILPKHIECTLSFDGNPVVGLMLLVEFVMVRKNSYVMIFGPSDKHGKAVVTLDEIKVQAKTQLELALMDFDEIESAFAGRLIVSIMTKDEIKNAIAAYDIYRSIVIFPVDYKSNLENALLVLEKINVEEIALDYVVSQ